MSAAPKVSFFKKGKTRPVSTRQRSPAPSSPPPSALMVPVDSKASEVVIPTRKATSRILTQGTKRPRRDTDEDEDSGRVDVNWASGSSSNMNAALEILEGDEAEALLARKRAKLDAGEEEDVGPDDGLYKGQAGYKNHITKNKEIPKAMRVGPQKSTSTIRTVTIVDYQPDVCKDYKGTLCLFPHSSH
jgi:RING finger protein 113A